MTWWLFSLPFVKFVKCFQGAFFFDSLSSLSQLYRGLLFTSSHHFDLFNPLYLFLSLDVLTLPKSTSAKRLGLVRFVDESTNFLVTSRRTAKRVYSNRGYHIKHNKHQDNNGSKWKLGIPTWFWAISHRGRWKQWSLPNSDEGVRSGGTYKSMGCSMLHHTNYSEYNRLLALTMSPPLNQLNSWTTRSPWWVHVNPQASWNQPFWQMSPSNNTPKATKAQPWRKEKVHILNVLK